MGFEILHRLKFKGILKNKFAKIITWEKETVWIFFNILDELQSVIYSNNK